MQRTQEDMHRYNLQRVRKRQFETTFFGGDGSPLFDLIKPLRSKLYDSGVAIYAHRCFIKLATVVDLINAP